MASIMTGRYAHQTGMLGLMHTAHKWQFDFTCPLLPEYFRNAGYYTALYGIQKISLYVKKTGYLEIQDGAFTADQLSGAAGNFFSKYKEDKPFFLFLGFNEPHRINGNVPSAECFGYAPDSSRGIFVPGYIPQRNPAEKKTAQKEFASLQGAVKAFDYAVGGVLSQLEKANHQRRTIVMLFSDLGIAMPGAKGTLYDAGTGIPLIIRLPACNTDQKKYDNRLISSIDIFPSLCGLASLPAPENISGINFAGKANGYFRNELFMEKNFHDNYDPIRAIRTSRYKYIVNFECQRRINLSVDILKSAVFTRSPEYYLGERPQLELYHLENDSLEQKNLAGQADISIMNELRTKLLTWMQETKDPLLSGPIKSNYYQEAVNSLEKNTGHCNFFFPGIPENKREEILRYDQILSGILSFIDSNYPDKITMRSICRRYDLEYTSFSRYFKKITGFHFNDYLNQVRVHYASLLLKNTCKSVLEIALACGFSSPGYFAGIYKKIKGRHPRQDKNKI
ncbi:MAG TPA: hypothetical protein DC049_02575 [Spirochaetia bacterium]|nr:hypothetical protein [Spirochaetia bacterium]